MLLCFGLGARVIPVMGIVPYQVFTWFAPCAQKGGDMEEEEEKEAGREGGSVGV